VSLLLERDELEAARRDGEAGLALHPENAELHALRASIAQRQERFEVRHGGSSRAVTC